MINFNFSFDPRISLEQRVGFQMAAAIWRQFIADNIDVNLQIVSSKSLGRGGKAIGGAAPIFHQQQYGVYREYLKVDATLSQPGEAPSIDEKALASLQTGNTTDLMVNGEIIDGNTDILLTSAQAKALGMGQALTLDNGTTWTRDLVSNNGLDGAIFVSQKFDWSYDFNRTGEAPEGTLDFLSMALHEIGHQLGFVSSLDGTLKAQGLLYGDSKLADFTALDLFRHSSISSQIQNPDGSVNDLSVGEDAYFSIDGGATNLGNFATGQDTSQGGDGQQASHWQRLEDALGIMDPTLAYQERLVIQERDLQALDVLGYEVNYGALQQGLDLNSLWANAQRTVEVQMGIESGTLARSYGGGGNQDLYELGYSQWWQLMESQMLELGYSQWWQVYELGYSQWWQQYETGGEVLELGYSQWWQEFETQILELGYSQWWQEFEGNLLELGYSQWWQLFELGYSQWWQEVETFFAKVETGDTTSNQPSSSDNAPVTDDFGNLEIVETIASEGDDIIGGSLDNDIVLAGAGDDLVDGAEGNDILIGNIGADIIFGGEGDDTLLGGEGDDRLLGEQGNDELQGELGDDRLYGGDGNDHLDGGEGKDLLNGNSGKDILLGRSGDDVLRGGVGNDIAVGENGNDVLYGDEGDDWLYGDRYQSADGIFHDTADFYLLSQILDLDIQNSTGEDRGLSGNLQTYSPQLILLNSTESELVQEEAISNRSSKFKVEAEDLTWKGKTRIQGASFRSGGLLRSDEKSKKKDTIESTLSFSGKTGRYDIIFGYHDLPGEGIISLESESTKLGDIKLDQDIGLNVVDIRNFRLSTLHNISFTQGEELLLTITTDGEDKGYLDYIRFIPTTNSLDTENGTTISTEPATLSSTPDAPPFVSWNRIEAEDMLLQGDTKLKATKNGSLVIETKKESTLSTEFEGSSGYYNIILGYHDNDGKGEIAASVNGLQISRWLLDKDLSGKKPEGKNFTTHQIENVYLDNTSNLAFDIKGDKNDKGYVDYVEFIPVSEGDILRGGSGRDILYGGEGNDKLYGENEFDNSVVGSSSENSDLLVGGSGNDLLQGNSGNDHLIGSDSKAAGKGEQDILTGGTGQDLFVLGDNDHAYYSFYTDFDYATITDFDETLDSIVLHGMSNHYTQQQSGRDLQLYHQDDLVAIVQGISGLELEGSAVQYVWN